MGGNLHCSLIMRPNQPLKKGSLSLLIFLNWSVHRACIWTSLQTYVLPVRFVYCRMEEEKDSPNKIHTPGCWVSVTMHSSSLLDSTSTTSELLPLKTCFYDISRIASSPMQPFRLLQSECQLSHELSQHIEAGRQMVPPLTKPIFLFPIRPPEGSSLPQFS